MSSKSTGILGIKSNSKSDSTNNPKSNGGDKSGDLSSSNSGGDKSGDLSGSHGGNPKHHGGNSGNVPTQPVNQMIQGTACNDTLHGNNSGRDTIVGTTGVARGVGERDVLIGGNASDTFVLGDTHGSFYVGQGNADYAQIQNFNRCNDGIQLAGSAQDYSISFCNGISSIYSNAGGGHDLIANVDSGCSALDLTAKYFQFVQPACGDSM